VGARGRVLLAALLCCGGVVSDVLAALVEKGWQGPHDDNCSPGSRYVWASRQMFPDRPICDCNDRQASLTVTHHSFHAAGHHHQSYEVALRFEKHRRWYDLKAYSLNSLEDVEEAIPRIIAAGRAVEAS
jgi:hypothetical protein